MFKQVKPCQLNQPQNFCCNANDNIIRATFLDNLCFQFISCLQKLLIYINCWSTLILPSHNLVLYFSSIHQNWNLIVLRVSVSLVFEICL
ncbi:hypothetical protein KUTeg_014642 [Tegillarca granosa]|uniref:Uncharacterized protein n=1 Tax=Tegillarca granosa TaxID=220873 RepID=A0ABQ9EW57_TEGGR|nr:hypothetical protein KUTeg_014642 [Tegillarca granosa]